MSPKYAALRQGRRVWTWLCMCVLLAVSLPAAAQSCPGTHTYVVNGDTAASFNLGAGESLRIASGTLSGSVALAGGSTVCVEPAGTLDPANMNTFAGTLENHGTSFVRGANFSTGAIVRNFRGLLTFTGGNNANGAITVSNFVDGRMSVADNVTLPNGSIMQNFGDFEVQPGYSLDLQFAAVVQNAGTMDLNGDSLTLSGTVLNDGFVRELGEFHLNGGSLTNNCSIVASAAIRNSGGTLANNGYMMLTGSGGILSNQGGGTITQAVDALIVGTHFYNDANVGGYGRYYFTDETRNQGQFNGSSATQPIVFYDETQTSPPDIFDVGNAPTNTVRVQFDPPGLARVLVECFPEYPNQPTADLSVTKDNGTTTQVVGEATTYTIVVSNAGPDGVEDSLLRDVPDALLACTAVTCTATSGGAVCPAPGSGAGELSMDNLTGAGVSLDLPADASITLQVECTLDDPP